MRSGVVITRNTVIRIGAKSEECHTVQVNLPKRNTGKERVGRWPQEI